MDGLSSIDVLKALANLRDSIVRKQCFINIDAIKYICDLAKQYEIIIPDEVVNYLKCKSIIIENRKPKVLEKNNSN